MSSYPINVVIEGRRCLVVGAGRVAAQKAGGLLECRAAVTVVAPELGDEVEELIEQDHDGQLTVERRRYRRGEVAGYRLAITATDDSHLNRQVFMDGEAAGVWVNSADDPANCAFTLPARIRQGELLVTFSTGGASPALAKWLRRRFTREFGPEYAELVRVLASERAERQAGGQETEGLDWQSALDSGMLDLIRSGRVAEAKGVLTTCLSSSSG